MAGDSTGAVFILRMTDVLRAADAERHRRWQDTEAKRRAAMAAKAQAEEAARAAAEAERKRVESLLAATKPPLLTLEFPGGTSSLAALPPRQMVRRRRRLEPRLLSYLHPRLPPLPPHCLSAALARASGPRHGARRPQVVRRALR